MKPFETNVSSIRGAPMGRRSDKPEDFTGIKCRMVRVPFVAGCYDKGGAYWGSPENLYCAWGENDEEQIVTYFRAPDRQAALAIMRKHGAIINR